MNEGFYTIRCPRCKDKKSKIGEYRGTPVEGFEVGFWCRHCKKSILISWVKLCTGYTIHWRVREG